MKKLIFLLLFFPIILSSGCKKDDLKEENLHGTWIAAPIIQQHCGCACFASKLTEIQIKFSANSIAFIEYHKENDDSSYCFSKGFWELKEKSKKERYLTLWFFPDSSKKSRVRECYETCTYKIDCWNNKDCCDGDNCILLTFEEGGQGGQDFLCTRGSLWYLQTKLTKID